MLKEQIHFFWKPDRVLIVKKQSLRGYDPFLPHPSFLLW